MKFSVLALAPALALGPASAFTGLHRQAPTALSPGFKSAFKTKLTSAAPALKVRRRARTISRSPCCSPYGPRAASWRKMWCAITR